VTVVALDFGAERTGVAVSDAEHTIARPLDPVLKANSREGFEQLLALIGNLAPDRVIVGLPVGLQGTETTQTRQSRSFADRLRQALDVPVELHDERFTSQMADRVTRETGTSTSRDSLAACHLLESWMQSQ
jgi:putative Holliday junction resolvase